MPPPQFNLESGHRFGRDGADALKQIVSLLCWTVCGSPGTELRASYFV
jgi:hypothetical protein